MQIKVVNKIKTKPVAFKDLPIGQPFMVDENLYIKVGTTEALNCETSKIDEADSKSSGIPVAISIYVTKVIALT